MRYVYHCKFLDPKGKPRWEIPMIGVTESAAIRRAHALFADRDLPGSFELWRNGHKIVKITPPQEGVKPAARPAPSRVKKT
jgi:hypothetical protein